MDIFQKAERYALKFTEESVSVREEIDVDVDSGTEVILVPGHNNNKEPMEVMNDFVAVRMNLRTCKFFILFLC